MSQKILIKRGLKANLPTLSEGELAFTTDTEELFIGSRTGNIKTSISTLEALTDVDATNKVDGYVLQYDSTVEKYVSKALPVSAGGSGSVVSDSTTNGYIIVDGSQIQVYDDTTLKNQMGILSNLQTSSKSDLVSALNEVKSDIPTSLSGLSDIDVTNKTNGYGMIYNSTTGKVALSPLPSGSGSGATNMSGLSDVDVTSIAPVEGNILTYTSGKWKPEAPSAPSSANVYEIELSRWGIKQGLPAKPYTSQNFIDANNNITGINNALSWAYQNNYNYVVLPKGSYAICYPNPINTQPYMTIDFNGSTLKVIYDSVNKSPFDDSPSTQSAWQFIGDSIHVMTPNTHIINLILIGDRIDRSWVNDTNGTERKIEGTNGVKFSAGAHNSSIRYCNLSYYMGDAIALYFQPANTVGSIHTEMGSFDTTGVKVTGVTTKSVRTSSTISLPAGMPSFSMIGLGYSPITTIPNQQYNVYFYDINMNFISYKTNVRTRDLIQVPTNGAYVNLSWEGDGTYDGGAVAGGNPPYMAILIQNGVGDNIQVEYNEIHRCHRGGMFLGTNNALIRRNYFHDTGAPGGMDIDGLPQFTDGTRYCIDTEDNIGQNCKILENVFENSNLGVCLRGEYNEFSGNEIRNCPTGLKLYSQRHINVEKNYFYYSGFNDFSWTNYWRDWQINNNIFNNSSVSFLGTGTIASVSDNYFVSNSSFGSTVEVLNCKGNVFDGSYTSVGEPTTIYDGCVFINNGYIAVNFNTNTIYDKIVRCNFLSGGYVSATNLEQITIRDCNFTDGYVYYNTGALKITLWNCKVNNSNYPLVYNPSANSIGNVNYSLEILNNCNISLGLSAPNWTASTSYSNGNQVNNYANIVMPSTYNGFYYLCTTTGQSGATEPNWSTAATEGATIQDNTTYWQAHAIPKCPILYAFNWGNLTIQNSSVAFNVYNPYTKAFLDNTGDFTGNIVIKSSTLTASPSTASNNASKATEIYIDAESTLTNVSLTNPGVPIQSDKMSSFPTGGTYTLGQSVLNSNPQPGQYMGWVCTSSGIACANTWAASTAYSLGNRVYSGTSVFQVTQAGTSGTSTPNFSGVALNGTVTDNNGLTTSWVASHSYNVNDIVAPSTPNGWYYKCAQAGTSGSTEPAWHTDGGATTDNTVRWYAYKYVIWQNVGTLAVFNPYGLISS